MEMVMVGEDQVSSLTLHVLSYVNFDESRQFIEKHGGSVVQLVPAEEENYRIDFPAGTRRKRNQTFTRSQEECFDLIFPDGAYLSWYSGLKIDGFPLANIFVTGLDPDDPPTSWVEELDRLRG